MKDVDTVAKDDVQNNTGASAHEAKRFLFWQNAKDFLFDYVRFFPFAAVAWLAGCGLLSYALLFSGVAFYFAVPFGLIAGTVSFILCLHFTKAMHTAEVNVSSGIYLVLIAMLAFSFIQSAKKARRSAEAKKVPIMNSVSSSANVAAKP